MAYADYRDWFILPFMSDHIIVGHEETLKYKLADIFCFVVIDYFCTQVV